MKRTQTITTLSATAVAALALALSLPLAETAGAASHSSAAQSPGTRTQAGSNRPEAVGEKATPLSKADRTFLEKAAEINLCEARLGKAAEHSSEADIKKIGQGLVRDHTAAQEQLQKLAASKGVILPSQPNRSQQEKIAAIEGKTGEQFDKQFLQQQIQGHQQAIALFEKEASRTADPDIKAWANQMIPTLKSHLASVQSGHPEAIGEQGRKQKQAPPKSKQPMYQHEKSASPVGD